MSRRRKRAARKVQRPAAAPPSPEHREERRPPRSRAVLLACCGALLATVLAIVFARSLGAPDPATATGSASAADAPDAAAVAGDPLDRVRAEFEQIAERLFESEASPVDRGRSARLRRELARPGLDDHGRLVLQGKLVESLLFDAQVAEAAGEVEEMLALAAARTDLRVDEAKLHALRGLVYLRQAEVENCIRRHNRECCVFPLRDGGVHVDKEPAEKAAESYFASLRARPDDLATRWLLNITHMAQGSYPDAVPEDALVPDKGVCGATPFPRFYDVATSVGIARMNHAGGVVADDMDGDGLLDLVLSSWFPDEPLAYYRNEGDGTFVDRAAAAGLDAQLGGLNLLGADYDNDGDVDLLVLRGAWLFEEGRIRKSLLRNDGAGGFTDVTRESGLGVATSPSQTAAWLDYDNDGLLDLYIGNESCVDGTVAAPVATGDHPSQLFHNEGDGTFVEVAERAGVTNDRYCKGVAAGDYDDDGWTDLYVSNLGRNRLYRNEGDGTFTDVAEELGVLEPMGRSFATWFFDCDNDGDLDLFVAGYDSGIGDLAAWYLGLPFHTSPPRLYRNQGDGTFEDVTRQVGLWRPMAPMGAGFGDLDNDGWLDVYLATGTPEYEAIMPNVMLRNRGGYGFQDVTLAGGFGNLQKGHGVAFVDIDSDGDQDVFNELGGWYEGDAFYNTLYENPGNANRFLALKLVGRASNRPGYGARITVRLRTPDGERSLHRAVGSLSSFGSSPSRQEIGLGDARSIESVEVFWPASATRQRLVGLELDSFYEITEGVDVAKKLEPRRIVLGSRD